MKTIFKIMLICLATQCFGAVGDKELKVDGAKWIWNNNSQKFSISASSSMSESVDYVWPALDGNPSQTLITDGSGVLSFVDVNAVAGTHKLLSITHTDAVGTPAGDVVRGSIIFGNATPKWDALAIGAANTFLKSDGTDVAWGTIDISDSTNLAVTAPIVLTDDTLSITVQKDIVAGVGLSGGEDNVLPGADADTTLTFDATELDALTWSDGANASNAWTFDVSGTDHTMTAGNGVMTFSNEVIINGLTASLGVYTDGSKQLTSTPPTSGVLGYWSRAGTAVSLATVNDDITMGSATVDAGTFSMIQGTVGSDPTFSISISTNDVAIVHTVGKMTIDPATDIILRSDTDVQGELTVITDNDFIVVKGKAFIDGPTSLQTVATQFINFKGGTGLAGVFPTDAARGGDGHIEGGEGGPDEDPGTNFRGGTVFIDGGLRGQGGSSATQGDGFVLLATKQGTVGIGTATTPTKQLEVDSITLDDVTVVIDTLEIRGPTTNIAMGDATTLDAITGGTLNISIGNGSGTSINSGMGNIIIGEQAGRGITSQNQAIVIGWLAGVSGGQSQGVIIGAEAGRFNTGSRNVLMGFEAGEIGDGSDNVFIGYRAGKDETGSDTLIIDNEDVGNEAANRLHALIYGLFQDNAAGPALTFNINSLTLSAETDTDLVVNFVGTDSTGILTWMEDEDYFKFSDDVVLDLGVLYLQETTTPTAIANHGAIYTKSNNELFFQDGAGVEHLVHGDAFSNLWFHDVTVDTVTISTADTFVIVTSFDDIGEQDDLGNLVSSTSTNDMTVGTNGAGQYKATFHLSAGSTGAADEFVLVVGQVLATPLTISAATNATPIVCTSIGHGMRKGDMVTISGGTGNTAVNGDWFLKPVTADTFTLLDLQGNNSVGNGVYDADTADVDVVYHGNILLHRTLAQGQLGTGGANADLQLATADKLKLFVANIGGTDNISFTIVNMEAKRIGD